MAFENIHSANREKSLLPLCRALRHMIPEKFLVVGLDPIASTPDRRWYAIYYDRDAHREAHYAQHERQRLDAVVLDLNAREREIPSPPSVERVRGFLEGFRAH